MNYSTPLTEQQKAELQAKVHKATNRFMRTLYKITADLNLSFKAIYFDQSFEGVRTYPATWDWFLSTKEEIEDAFEKLRTFGEEDQSKKLAKIRKK